MTWDAVRLLVSIWAIPAVVVVGAVIAVRAAYRRRKPPESRRHPGRHDSG